jgi:hypothetical protein
MKKSAKPVVLLDDCGQGGAMTSSYFPDLMNAMSVPFLTLAEVIAQEQGMDCFQKGPGNPIRGRHEPRRPHRRFGRRFGDDVGVRCRRPDQPIHRQSLQHMTPASSLPRIRQPVVPKQNCNFLSFQCDPVFSR